MKDEGGRMKGQSSPLDGASLILHRSAFILKLLCPMQPF
jgi:hypothetical protein